MTTYLLHDENGRAVSIGTVLADPMPDEFTVVELSDADAALLALGRGRWDESSLSVVAVPEDEWPIDELESQT